MCITMEYFSVFVKSFNIFQKISRLLKPNEIEQSEALLAAMAEILWNIGEKSKVVVALPGDASLIPHSHTYFQDSVTEKVKFLN